MTACVKTFNHINRINIAETVEKRIAAGGDFSLKGLHIRAGNQCRADEFPFASAADAVKIKSEIFRFDFRASFKPHAAPVGKSTRLGVSDRISVKFAASVERLRALPENRQIDKRRH